MSYKHPLWESHEFNGYKQDPKHYSISNEEKKQIREAHSSNKKENLSEGVSLNATTGQVSYGGNGGPNIQGDNHGMANDRLGLVVDHLNQVSTNIKKESMWEFVQDVSGWMKRLP
jgi:hypothetical protein|tara:strand:+ start:4461 stop:4805 length:345 start_codon:yes stop_codon:yes gene_type:complete